MSIRFCSKYAFVTIRVIDVNERFFCIFISFDSLKLTEREKLKEKESEKMKKNGKKELLAGSLLIGAFVVWTILIQLVDVQSIGVNGTKIGFATWNRWFHQLTGANMDIFTITDWLGLVPIFICMVFGVIGVTQLVKRGSLFKVDSDIIVLGIYYVIVIFSYLIFEMIPINYRPILIEGRMEASYPSSTTLLVLCVMPTLVEQVNRRIKREALKKVIIVCAICFSGFMVVGRLISGVHWFTDIVGAVMLSIGVFSIYKGFVLMCSKVKVKYSEK